MSSQATSSSSSATRQQSTRCLHLTNLDAAVDEYLLLRLCRPHGKITKLDHVRHKTGPLRGKPRGFAFVEFETSQEALTAMQALHDKAVRGKKIRVNFAHVAEYDPSRPRKEEAGKPTALSVLKSKAQPESTNAKIKALEAKLQKLEQQDSGGQQPSSSASTTTSSTKKTS